MLDFVSKLSYDVADLRELMRLLCSPDGCPWDREQTHESIRRNMLEEAYEAVEAIDSKNAEHLIEELGDVLMQVVFHADIAERANEFTLDDIADATCKKLISRHPHVFGEVKVETGDDYLAFWDEMKRKEKHHKTTSEAMSSVASSLPALWRAEKIQKKAAKVGFDWPDYSGATDALRTELIELDDAICTNGNIEEELGDLIFSAVNVARFFDIDPEDALNNASTKFIERFTRMENMAVQQGNKLEDMSLDEMETLYQTVKAQNNAS
ncbi:MAG: nucleoside triphosphate pyrophosphohydrolase [Oscillospiraceae bacterium]|nr:nucleoside triphosphate pyrophosphohydrolase [Oscillospiraceae bacterium]